MHMVSCCTYTFNDLRDKKYDKRLTRHSTAHPAFWVLPSRRRCWSVAQIFRDFPVVFSRFECILWLHISIYTRKRDFTISRLMSWVCDDVGYLLRLHSCPAQHVFRHFLQLCALHLLCNCLVLHHMLPLYDVSHRCGPPRLFQCPPYHRHRTRNFLSESFSRCFPPLAHHAVSAAVSPPPLCGDESTAGEAMSTVLRCVFVSPRCCALVFSYC